MRGENRRENTTSCAMLYLAGGRCLRTGQATSCAQCLVAHGKTPNETWSFLTQTNNGTADVRGTKFPPTLLNLPTCLSTATGLTAQWPEMLVTGARSIVLGRDEDRKYRCFYAAWRFQKTRFGTDNQWVEIPMPTIETNEYLMASSPIDQHLPNKKHSFRLSRFLLVFQNKEGKRKEYLLTIPAMQS